MVTQATSPHKHVQIYSPLLKILLVTEKSPSKIFFVIYDH
jgi:hypothetical protein